MIKVMIADDQELIRESLKVVVDMNQDMQVTGLAADGAELIAAVAQDAPDVILMDVRMPRVDGVAATREIKERYPDVRIIILTTFDDDEYIYNALKYGASGYLLKGVSVAELAAAIRKVVAGGSMLNPDVATKALQLFSRMARQNIAIEVDEQGAAELTATERRIVSLVGCGLSNKEIAAQLNLSDGTVRNGLSSCLSKLGLRDRTQLAIWAVERGLAGSEQPS